MKTQWSRMLCRESHPVFVPVGSRSHPGRHPAGGLLDPWGESQEDKGGVRSVKRLLDPRKHEPPAPGDCPKAGEEPTGTCRTFRDPESLEEAPPGLCPELGVCGLRVRGSVQHLLGGRRHREQLRPHAVPASATPAPRLGRVQAGTVAEIEYMAHSVLVCLSPPFGP